MLPIHKALGNIARSAPVKNRVQGAPGFKKTAPAEQALFCMLQVPSLAGARSLKSKLMLYNPASPTKV